MTNLELVSSAPSEGRRSRGNGTQRDRRVAPGRPHDVREVWSVERPRALRDLRAAAAAHGVDPDTVAGLLVELSLSRRDLMRLWPSVDFVSMLDECARAARVTKTLPAAEAVYLRELLRGDAARDQPLTDCVLLPARLSIRILEAGGPEALLPTDELDRAIRWEVSALISGRTISEWALAEALARSPG